MPAIALPPPWVETSRDADEPVELTLLDLVWAVGEVTEDEREVVATVQELIESGRVRLCGNFRGVRKLRA